jgi:hypothetical protein
MKAVLTLIFLSMTLSALSQTNDKSSFYDYGNRMSVDPVVFAERNSDS